MTTHPIRSALALLLCTVVAPALAESLAASASSAGISASSAGSASLRGSSDSISGTSDSSRNDRAVADGQYRVAAVETIEGRPGMVRLTMRPAAPGDAAQAFRLDLPQRALGDRPIVAGDLVQARNRPYGVEFARAESAQPFFLVLDDAWDRDLQTRVLTR